VYARAGAARTRAAANTAPPRRHIRRQQLKRLWMRSGNFDNTVHARAPRPKHQRTAAPTQNWQKLATCTRLTAASARRGGTPRTHTNDGSTRPPRASHHNARNSERCLAARYLANSLRATARRYGDAARRGRMRNRCTLTHFTLLRAAVQRRRRNSVRARKHGGKHRVATQFQSLSRQAIPRRLHSCYPTRAPVLRTSTRTPDSTSRVIHRTTFASAPSQHRASPPSTATHRRPRCGSRAWYARVVTPTVRLGERRFHGQRTGRGES